MSGFHWVTSWTPAEHYFNCFLFLCVGFCLRMLFERKKP